MTQRASAVQVIHAVGVLQTVEKHDQPCQSERHLMIAGKIEEDIHRFITCTGTMQDKLHTRKMIGMSLKCMSKQSVAYSSAV